jgi:two-component system response regulator FixJ
LYAFVTGGFELNKVYPVYVVDDDEGVRALLADLCEDRSIVCRGFASGEEFLAALDELEPGCVLLDMRLPRRSGLQVQAEMARRGRVFPVIAITGYGGVDMAVESMKMGALDFIEKPFANDVLFEALELGFARLSGTGGTARAPA